MKHSSKADLEKQVILGAREYGISNVLFRNVVADRLGVNITDMECLGLLFHKGLATPSEISRYTGLSSGATTAMLDRLEQSGIIERQPNPDDRRGFLIAIVKSMADKIAPWFTSSRKAQDDLVSGYSEKELQVLADFFEKSISNWNAEREKLQHALAGSRPGQKARRGLKG